MGNQTSILDKSNFKYLKNYSPSKFSSSISQEKTHYIILACNGESQNILNNKNNSELSGIGKEQAMDIGCQLKLNLLGINFSEINIFTSPYIKNIQTALYMTNIIDYGDSSNKFLYINKNLADVYNPDFDYNSTQDLVSQDLYTKLIVPLYQGKKYNLENKNLGEIKNIINKGQTEKDILKQNVSLKLISLFNSEYTLFSLFILKSEINFCNIWLNCSFFVHIIFKLLSAEF